MSLVCNDWLEGIERFQKLDWVWIELGVKIRFSHHCFESIRDHWMAGTSRACPHAEWEAGKAVCETYSSCEVGTRNTSCNTDLCCNLCSSSPQQDEQQNGRRKIFSGRWIHRRWWRADVGAHHPSYATTSRARRNRNKTGKTDTWETPKHWERLRCGSPTNHARLILAGRATAKRWIYASWAYLFQRKLQTSFCNAKTDIRQSLLDCRLGPMLLQTWMEAQMCRKHRFITSTKSCFSCLANLLRH